MLTRPSPPTAVDHGRDPDFSRRVLEEMYRYRLKRRWLAFTLWFTAGLFGGHRIYLERSPTAILMFVTLGGAGIWWLIDLVLLNGMVRSYNEDQVRRREAGLPPRALRFMPPLHQVGSLDQPPAWAGKRSRRLRLVGDVLVLGLAGLIIGQAARDGDLEPVFAAVVLIAIILLGARWDRLIHLPVLRVLDRWNHRLRLFYFFNDPGGPLALALRPITLIFSLFRRKRRTEARLYLQLGIGFGIVFALVDATQAVFAGVPPAGLAALLLTEVIADMLTVFASATPLGAVLTTHVLLQRKDVLVWALSLVALAAMVFGVAV